MDFLTHFQSLIQYEIGTDLLTSLRKYTSTHISDHIHEWRWRRQMIKVNILDQLLEDSFTKSLFPPIARVVSMGGAITEEKAISHAQYLDLVYSQSDTLYDMIPHAPFLSNEPSRPTLEPHADGVVGSITNTQNTPSPTQKFEVNVVQSTSSHKPRGKKKNKDKSKKFSNQQKSTKTTDNQLKMKYKLPCMICMEENYTKDCPHREEFAKFMKGTSQPVVLTNPFPTHQQQMVTKTLPLRKGENAGHSHHGDASSSVAQVFMCKDTVRLMTRAKNYDTPPYNHANGGDTDKPSTSTPPPSSAPLHIERLVAESMLSLPKGTI
jgi:hypothetical protein